MNDHEIWLIQKRKNILLEWYWLSDILKMVRKMPVWNGRWTWVWCAVCPNILRIRPHRPTATSQEPPVVERRVTTLQWTIWKNLMSWRPIQHWMAPLPAHPMETIIWSIPDTIHPTEGSAPHLLQPHHPMEHPLHLHQVTIYTHSTLHSLLLLSGPRFICIYRIYRIYRPWWYKL